jgi:alpha-1,2-mannosyltransferase
MNVAEATRRRTPPAPPAARSSALRAAPWVSLAVAAGISAWLALRYQTDFRVYLMSAREAFSPSLYAQSVRGEFFTYPPFAALAFVPLELLGGEAAQLTFAAVNLAALVALIEISVRAVRPQLAAPARWRWALGLTAPFLLLDPVLVTVSDGEVNLILAAAVCWDMTIDRRSGSPALPLGVATGLATAVKLTPLIFIPFLFLTGRRRGACACLATFACCEAVAFALTPRASWTYWTTDIFSVERLGGSLGSADLLAPADQSLTAVLDRLHHAPVAAGALWGASLLVGAAGLTIAVLACRRWSPVLGAVLCAMTGLAVSPVTWTHHMVWVVPMIIWLAAAPGRPRLGRPAAVLTALLFWCAPVWWIPGGVPELRDNLELHENPAQFLAGSSFFDWTILVLAGAAIMLFWHRAGHRGTRNRLPAVRVGGVQCPAAGRRQILMIAYCRIPPRRETMDPSLPSARAICRITAGNGPRAR